MNDGKFQEIRLDETKPLRASMDVSGELRAGSGASPLDVFFRKVEEIQGGLQKAENLISNLESLRTPNFEDGESSSEVKDISDNVQEILMGMKTKLQDLVNYCNVTPVEESDNQIRKNQVSALKKRLLKSTEDRQKQEKLFKDEYKKRATRQFSIANPDANKEDIEKALEDGEMSFFSKSVIDSTRVSSANSVLSNVQERLVDIKRITKTINDLHILLIDLQNMSEIQDNLLEKNIRTMELTNQHLSDGNVDLEAATKNVKGRQKKQMILTIVVLLLTLLAIVLIVSYALGVFRAAPI